MLGVKTHVEPKALVCHDLEGKVGCGNDGRHLEEDPMALADIYGEVNYRGVQGSSLVVDLNMGQGLLTLWKHVLGPKCFRNGFPVMIKVNAY